MLKPYCWILFDYSLSKPTLAYISLYCFFCGHKVTFGVDFPHRGQVTVLKMPN